MYVFFLRAAARLEPAVVFLWVEEREEPLEEKKRERKRRGEEREEKKEGDGEGCAMRSVRPRCSGCRNGSRPSWDLGAAFACYDWVSCLTRNTTATITAPQAT